MANKMIIDASHPEETRVVVLKGNRVEEFDFESASKKPLRGNIYLAKVTRVEPSLQAAFVDYGGNRHGFLAFSEIHPDYYQIPVADRQALLEEEARSHRDDDDEPNGERRSRRHRRPRRRRPKRGRRRRDAFRTGVVEDRVRSRAKRGSASATRNRHAADQRSGRRRRGRSTRRRSRLRRDRTSRRKRAPIGDGRTRSEPASAEPEDRGSEPA